jgi:hypothetical protein
VVIFIAIHPVELQRLRDFGSEADFFQPQRAELQLYLKKNRIKIPLHTPALPPRLGGLLAPARSFERF